MERQNGTSRTLLGVPARTVLSYTDSGLPVNHSYTHRVRAVAGTDRANPGHSLVSANLASPSRTGS